MLFVIMNVCKMKVFHLFIIWSGAIHQGDARKNPKQLISACFNTIIWDKKCQYTPFLKFFSKEGTIFFFLAKFGFLALKLWHEIITGSVNQKNRKDPCLCSRDVLDVLLKSGHQVYEWHLVSKRWTLLGNLLLRSAPGCTATQK